MLCTDRGLRHRDIIDQLNSLDQICSYSRDQVNGRISVHYMCNWYTMEIDEAIEHVEFLRFVRDVE